jgi:NAD(P)-dependent dehydrogenase (short-subunit alcohol dehydrogenase family)
MPENGDSDEISLKDQVVIVTGGGRGTGRAFALALADAGASVAVTARTQKELDETVELIRSSGGRAIAISGDVSDPSDVERVVSTTKNELGPVDILINNAGVTGPVGAEWESDPDEWWRTMEINMRGPYLMTRAVLPSMVSRKRGRIINISSAVTIRTIPYFAPYTVSKAAMIYYTQNLASQVREHGISVFAYHPGGPETEMSRHLAESPEVHDSVGNIFRGLYEKDAHTPMEIPVRDIMLMASGKADALTGRFLIHTDDHEEMLARADEIVSNDLYVLTRRT